MAVLFDADGEVITVRPVESIEAGEAERAHDSEIWPTSQRPYPPLTAGLDNAGGRSPANGSRPVTSWLVSSCIPRGPTVLIRRCQAPRFHPKSSLAKARRPRTA
jgi:hypothetical protein